MWIKCHRGLKMESLQSQVTHTIRTEDTQMPMMRLSPVLIFKVGKLQWWLPISHFVLSVTSAKLMIQKPNVYLLCPVLKVQDQNRDVQFIQRWHVANISSNTPKINVYVTSALNAPLSLPQPSLLWTVYKQLAGDGDKYIRYIQMSQCYPVK